VNDRVVAANIERGRAPVAKLLRLETSLAPFPACEFVGVECSISRLSGGELERGRAPVAKLSGFETSLAPFPACEFPQLETRNSKLETRNS
jgi:hypothetical protein